MSLATLDAPSAAYAAFALRFRLALVNNHALQRCLFEDDPCVRIVFAGDLQLGRAGFGHITLDGCAARSEGDCAGVRPLAIIMSMVVLHRRCIGVADYRLVP
eukprot:4019716-Pleurochrysis_carterae.AAC.6